MSVSDAFVLLPNCFRTKHVACSDLWDAHFAKIALMMHVFSWSGLYCLSRTLTNGMEMNILIVALYLLVHKEKTVFSLSTKNLHGSLKDVKLRISCLWLSMILVAWSIFIRPTIVLLWVSMFFFDLQLLVLITHTDRHWNMVS
jgi:hypothetical protein